MAGSWGAKKNGIRIGVFWDSILVSDDGTQARVTNAVIKIDRDVNIVDSSNHWEWSGGAVTDGSADNINVDGSGVKTVKSLGEQWNDLYYGSTRSVKFAAKAEGINYAGGTLYATAYATLPERQIDPPAAVTAVDVTGSGDSRTVTWTLTDPTNTASPVEGVRVAVRWDPAGSFVNVASLGVASSFTHQNIPADSRLEYRVTAYNTAGDAPAADAPAVVYTQPDAPTIGAAAKDASGDILLTFTNNAAWADRLVVQDSADGATWSTVDGLVPPGAASWLHESPSTAQTHRYRVAAATPDDQQSDWSATSNVVQLLAPPNAPTSLAPAGVAVDPADDNTLSWTHNPTDSTPQTWREVQWRETGGVWATLGGAAVATSAQTVVVPAGTWAGLTEVEWQVRTKGQHADWSPWSASALVPLTGRPVATISEPAATIVTSTVTPAVDYYDPAGLPQSTATVRLLLGGVTVETVSASGGAPLPAFAHYFANGEAVTLRATVRNAWGLQSQFVDLAAVVEYLPPSTPEVELVWNRQTGGLAITTSNTEGDGVETVDTDHQRLWRIAGDGTETLLIDNLEPNGSVVDGTAATTGQAYRLRAVSADGATADLLFTADPDAEVASWWWLTAAGQVARFRANPSRSRTATLAQESAFYAGRPDPVVTYGEAVTQSDSLEGVLILADGTDWPQVERVAIQPEPAVVRTPDGQRFTARIVQASAQDTNNRWQKATVQLERVGSADRPLVSLELE